MMLASRVLPRNDTIWRQTAQLQNVLEPFQHLRSQMENFAMLADSLETVRSQLTQLDKTLQPSDDLVRLTAQLDKTLGRSQGSTAPHYRAG